MRKESEIVIIPGFYSKELDNYRSLHIYLPGSYYLKPDKRYPVLYMHDGQNLFDPSDALFHKSWNMKETADRLIQEGKIQELIIVGIDNNSERGSEYCHFVPEGKTEGRRGLRKCEISRKARGILYEDFILHSVKPYIDANFRTLRDRDNTAMMGSSLGGLVTYLIGFRHPEVFGRLGILSPAFNWADFDILLRVKKEPLRLWMDTGEGEAYYVENTRRVVEALLDKGFIPGEDMAYYQVPGAIHNESSWGGRVGLPLLFLFGNTGRPVSCKLTGRNLIGRKGIEVAVNPIVQYDSGFIMTDIKGSYTVENPDILEIKSDGRVIPKDCGTTGVRYEICGLTDSVSYTVIDELSQTVRIELEIEVPGETPQQEKIFVYAGEFIEAAREGNGKYRCVMTAPRDWGYHFNIFLGESHRIELDRDGQPAPGRIYKAAEDMKLQCRVEGWAAR
jgi:predicted alpha/beta superfamily hydrolase